MKKALFVLILLLIASPGADATWTAGSVNSSLPSTGPNVVITSPSGTVSGSVNLQATCTGCSSVQWVFDGVPLSSESTSPYTLAVNTANYADGVHVVGAIGTGSGTETANPVRITTSNGVSNKTTLISATGNDSTCSPGGTACATMQKANSFTYHGGDSILFDVANPISVASITVGATNSTALILAGPSAGVGAGPTSITQNVFGTGSGWTLTVGTYNGSGPCVPLAGLSGGCSTITLSGNSIPSQIGMVMVVNLNYVTVLNLKIVGTGQALAGSRGIGIAYLATSGTNGLGVNIQNNEVIDFNTESVVWATSQYPAYPNFGTPCGVTVRDNYFHGSTLSYQGNSSGVFVLNASTCGNNTSVTVASNYTNNMGGVSGTDSGNGVLFLNGGSNFVDVDNVTTNGGTNSTTCGGPYGNWVFQQHVGRMSGNESAGNAPAAPGGGCDNGSFDIDHDNSGILFEYNYAHDSWGPALAILDTQVNAGNATGGHTIRYNIFENGGAQVIDGSTGMVGSDWSAASASDNFYNNNIWNGLNGTTDPVASKTISVFAFGMQPSAFPTHGMVIANNIFVTNSVNFVANANVVTYSQFNPGNLNPYLTWRNNAYYNIGTSTYQWREVNGGPGGINGAVYTTLATWSAGVNATGEIQSNPNFASPGGGQNVACWTVLSGLPKACGPSGGLPGYNLTSPGSSAFVGTGINPSTAFNFDVGAVDFYGKTLRTQFNIGADQSLLGCPQGDAFPDGCPGAPIATIPFPNALNGGGYSGQSWATRSPWNVPGVDYGVGVPTGTTLIDWQTIVGAGGTGPNTLTTNGATASGNVLHFASTSGVLIGMPVTGTNIPGSTTITAYTPTTITISNNVTSTGVANGATITINSGGSAVGISGFNFNISSNNVVVDSIDFSLHNGAQLVVSGSGVTIKNSNLFFGTNCSTTCNQLINFTSGANGTLLSNTIDGNGINQGASSAQSTLVAFHGGGSLTLEYNYFRNFLAHVIEYDTGTALNYHYNLVYNVTCNGSCGTPHSNFLQWGTGTQGTASVTYNFGYQPNDAGVGGQGFQFTPNSVVGALSFVFANNTLIYSPSGVGVTDAQGNVGNQTGLIYDNYIDSRGNSFFFADSTACPKDGSLNVYGAACSSGNPSNINPVTGAVITTTP